MAKLIFNNQTIQVGFSAAAQDGTGAASASYTNINASAAVVTCNVKSMSISRTANQVDLAGVCAVAEETFNTRSTGQIELEIYLNNADFSGYVFQGRLGYYVRVTFTPTGFSTQTYYGVVTNVSSGVEIDGAITEKASIKLGVA